MAMSDGGLSKSSPTSNAAFKLAAIESHKDFIEYCRDTLIQVSPTTMTLNTPKAPRKPFWRLSSRVNKVFTDMHTRIYTGKYRGLDLFTLPLLDYEAMAIVYQSDGCLGVKQKDVTINLCRLSKEDLKLFAYYMEVNLGVRTTIVRSGQKYFALRVKNKDRIKFMKGVKPYIHESFKYKLM